MGFLRRTAKQNGTDSEPLERITPLPPAERGAAEPERYCRIEVITLPAGDDRRLVYSVLDRSAQFLTSEMAVLLSQCRTFKTLEDHAEAVARVFELSPRGIEGVFLKSVELQFSELIERGLLVSDRELLERCRLAAEHPESSPPPISTVGVVTRDRPESLRCCLQSYVENTKAYGREAEFVVADDSVGAETRRQVKEMLREMARHEGLSIRYAGEEEKRRYAAALIAGGDLPPEVVEFALFDAERYGYTPGANRNSLLLETAGKMFFSTDDDTVCRLAVTPEVEDEDDYDDGDPESPDQMGVWLFPDRETALQESTFIDEDFLTLHEQLLGRQVASCVVTHGGIDVLNLERLAARDLGPIQSGTARVLVTLNGVLGDSGLRSPIAFRPMNRKSRQRLVRTDSDYLASRFSREVLRVVERPCINRRTWFLSAALAYDNRLLLPPFMPVARGEDGVFADTLKICFENSFLADLPRAVLHLPPEARSYTPEQVWETASSLPTATIISACVVSFQPWRGMPDGPAKLRALGQHLMDIGSMALADFEEFARMHVWQLQSSYISKIEDELQDYEELPDLWIEDVEKYLDSMREALRGPDYIIPYDVRPGLSSNEARLASLRLVTKFGELLRAWPDVIEKAKQLSDREERLTVQF